MSPKLPIELMDKIALMTYNAKTTYILKTLNLISQYTFDKMEKNVLIYGQVQGGKTVAIMNTLKSKIYEKEIKVLIVQNSLLVLKQYIQRLKSENISFQIVTKETQSIDKKVILLINNSYRYSYFKRIEPKRYILMLDESDQTIRSCPLKSYKTIHITATPYNYPKKLFCKFDRIVTIKQNPNYKAIDDLHINTSTNDIDSIMKFLQTKNGMILINKYSYVQDMKQCANILSQNFNSVPIILLTSEKLLYFQNEIKNIKEKTISEIIDSLKEHKHIIFIANRLSNRGLSYVSSDYTRHLTHQITKVRTSVSSFLQSLRILGIYKNNQRLELTIPLQQEKILEKYKKIINEFDPNTLVCSTEIVK
jgi:hypothetical protein